MLGNKFNYILFWILISGCATILPIPDDTMLDPNSDAAARLANERVQKSKLSDEEKNAASERLYYVFDYSRALDRYVRALEVNVRENQDLDNSYSLTNTIIGGLGSLSSVAVLASSAAVAAPVATGLWNVVGYVIQSNDIKPKIKEAQEKLQKAKDLQDKFGIARDEFDLFTFGAVSTQEADNAFKQWNQQIGPVLAETGKFLGRTLPTFRFQ